MGTLQETPLPRNPELADLTRRVEAARPRASRLLSGLTREQANRQPEPGGWPVAQCLHHLVITGQKMVPRLAWGVARARQKRWLAEGPFRYGWLGNWFVRQVIDVSSSPRRRFPAPRAFAPTEDHDPSVLLQDFLLLQDHWQGLLEKADGVDLARVQVTSAASRFVRLQLGQWFALLVGHQERHLGQAERARGKLGF